MASSEQISKHRPGYFTPKIKFTKEEDHFLRSLVERFGSMNWRKIASHMGTRNERQCRERWRNYLSPQVSDPQEWTPEEESRLVDAYSIIGPRWTFLASQFPGRSIFNVKNRLMMLQRRERRLIAIQQKLANAFQPVEESAETFHISQDPIAAEEPNQSDPADPFGFLSTLDEPFESLFGQSTEHSEHFECFCEW
jgi:hypothetical protein